MKDLTPFKQFAKPRTTEVARNNVVWSYTRVSSKDQLQNMSLENQKAANERFAEENDFQIEKVFGGTYESAKGDFTRSEFRKMFDELDRVAVKPYAILVYKISRFSRSGGGGIVLLNRLVREYGMHLIETSSGRSSDSDDDELSLFQGLLDARRENLNKLHMSVPGMKSFLRSGNHLGNCPRGYDHYGPRVKDFNRRHPVQKLVVNEEGRLFQKAWYWKLNGEIDAEIIRKLRSHGMTISKQRISDMWRNPFYAGIIVHHMLDDEPVKGHWEPLVSPSDFLKINDQLKSKGSSYVHKKENPRFPLAGFVKCAICNTPLTHYTNKKKDVDYYRCNYCRGMNMNANTTAKAIRGGAHDLFHKTLESYTLSANLVPLLKKQLGLTFKRMNQENQSVKRSLLSQLEEIQKNKKVLRQRFAFGKIDQDIYEEALSDVEARESNIVEALKETEFDLSNLDHYIDQSLIISQNIANYWETGDFWTRKRIQELVFPEGIYLPKEKTHYLTKRINTIFEIIHSLRATYARKEKGLTEENSDESLPVVAGVGLLTT